MKVLVLDENGELAKVIGLYLSGHGATEVVATHSSEEALKQLSLNVDVFFIHDAFTRPGNDLVWRTWRGLKSGETVILSGGAPPSGVRSLDRTHLTEELRDLVKSPIWCHLTDGAVATAVPLSPHLVNRLGVCPADLYLKLGDNNWIKLFHAGSPFGEREQKKFESKGVSEFWVLPADLVGASKYFEDFLSSLSPASVGDGALLSDTAELLLGSIHAAGFREELQAIVRVALKQILHFSKQNPQLQQFFDVMTRAESSWMIRHCMITSHVGCAIAANLGWSAEQTYLKITAAAFTHDIGLPRLDRSERDWGQLIEQAVGREKNYGELKAFHHHPIEGAQIIRRLKEFPPDTDKIVLEHHESPEGTGFPRGLTSSQISPLGCLFILSHHVADILLADFASLKECDLAKLVQLLKPERWQHGNFKKVWQAFEKTQLFG
jgi:putative nucleotidyltransferase with HDIG domain